MKSFLSEIVLFLLPSICMAKQYGGPHLYDFGLPSGDEVSSSLMKSIPLLILGFIIAYFSMWSKKDGEKRSNFGCVGIIIMGIGGIFLLPLLAYVELIVNSLIGIVLMVVIIGAIGYGIYSLFKSK